MTPTQTYLKSLNACAEARAWVGEQTLAQAVARCERREWLRWLATAPARAAYLAALAPACAALDAATAQADATYCAETTQALAAYDAAAAPARAAFDAATERAGVADLDTLRAMIQIPGDCT